MRKHLFGQILHQIDLSFTLSVLNLPFTTSFLTIACSSMFFTLLGRGNTKIFTGFIRLLESLRFIKLYTQKQERAFPRYGNAKARVFHWMHQNNHSSHTRRSVLFYPLCRKDPSTDGAIHWSLLASLTSRRMHLDH